MPLASAFVNWLSPDCQALSVGRHSACAVTTAIRPCQVAQSWLTCCQFLTCSIQALLSAPNPDDPLAENIAKDWKENETAAVKTGQPVWHKNEAEQDT